MVVLRYGRAFFFQLPTTAFFDTCRTSSFWQLQLNLNSNGEFSLQPERRFENQFGQQLSSSPKTEQQGLGMMSNNPGSYLVIAPQDSSQYASELDGRRNTPSSQYQQQSLYGAPSQGVYSSTAITPRELWNQQQQSGVPRRSVPATPSVLSSYATASAQPPSALNKYLQGPPSQASPYHSQGPGLGQGMGQGEYGPAARSPHYGDERERGQLLGERSSPLYPETRGLSPKYASNAPVRGPQHQQLQHQSPAGYYPPQQAPSGYGAPQHHQQHHQHQQQGPYGHMPSPHNMPPPPHHHSAAGYYPPGSQMAPPAIQPDLMFQVQFKRISKCYTNRSGYQINVRDFVVVEGDRGEDIGVVIEVFGMQEFLHRRMTDHRLMGGGDKDGNSHTVDCILRLATMHERQQLPDKFHTEKNIIQVTISHVVLCCIVTVRTLPYNCCLRSMVGAHLFLCFNHTLLQRSRATSWRCTGSGCRSWCTTRSSSSTATS